MIVFTSITHSYLDKAMVLAESVRRHHPSAQMHLVLGDYPRAGFEQIYEKYFDKVVHLDTFSEAADESWLFSHTIVELCTALKPLYALRLLQEGRERVVYLDPDTVLFSPMTELEDAHENADIILTPHLTEPSRDWQSIVDNEMSASLHGLYNLGFFSLKQSSAALHFCQWWADRLSKLCVGATELGQFTDQRIVDHATVFFPSVSVLRHKGFNVATWNMAERQLWRDGRELRVGGLPLKFYHFTGYDSGAGHKMLSRYGVHSPYLQVLWRWYNRALVRIAKGLPADRTWSLARTTYGQSIPDALRRFYRLEPVLQQLFAKPFSERGLWQVWQESASARRHLHEDMAMVRRLQRGKRAISADAKVVAERAQSFLRQIETVDFNGCGRICLWGANDLASVMEFVLLQAGVAAKRIVWVDRDSAAISEAGQKLVAGDYVPEGGDTILICAQGAQAQIADFVRKLDTEGKVRLVAINA